MLLEIKRAFLMIKRMNQGNAIINTDVPNNRAPKYMQQKLAELRKK